MSFAHLVRTCAAAGLLITNVDAAPPDAASSGAKLLYVQDFNNAASLGAGSNIKTSWPLGHGIHSASTAAEVQIYVDLQAKEKWGANPYTFSEGVLKITAAPTPGLPAPFTYTSGLVCTAGKFAFTYGYAEARIKMPGGKGFWPTFWMMKDNGKENQTWPPEVDIAQCSSRIPNESYPAVMWGNSKHPQKFGKFVDVKTDLSKDFHIYALEWTRDKMEWYIDGKSVMRHETPPGLSSRMYLMCSLACGDEGDWIGKPDGSTQSMWIDYIRVWDKKP